MNNNEDIRFVLIEVLNNRQIEKPEFTAPFLSYNEKVSELNSFELLTYTAQYLEGYYFIKRNLNSDAKKAFENFASEIEFIKILEESNHLLEKIKNKSINREERILCYTNMNIRIIEYRWEDFDWIMKLLTKLYYTAIQQIIMIERDLEMQLYGIKTKEIRNIQIKEENVRKMLVKRINPTMTLDEFVAKLKPIESVVKVENEEENELSLKELRERDEFRDDFCGFKGNRKDMG